MSIRMRTALASGLGALALALGAQVAQAAPDAAYQSPTTNLQCVYKNQVGIGCVSRNDGWWVVLKSYTGQVQSLYSPIRWGGAYRTVPYGTTLRIGGTFRLRSAQTGITVWSALTGRGFFLSRNDFYRF